MTYPALTPESAKQRSLRVPLDYVRPSRFQRCKTIVALAGCTIAAAYGAWILAGPDSARMQLSPGPVVSAHAPWEQTCETCHDNFSPLRADANAGAMKLLSAVIPHQRSADAFVHSRSGGHSDSAATVDVKCQVCHQVPDHHVSTKTLSVERCTACHIDHDGRTAKIAQPHDQHCTRCHANLAKPVQTFSKSENGVLGHPPFSSLEKDPGNIRFNHHLHMMKGIPAPDPRNQGLQLMTAADLLANVPLAIASQLHRPGGKPMDGRFDTSAPVELHCSSCHQLDSGPVSLSPQTSGRIDTAGAYLSPVRYEQHCQACHPLYYESSHTKQLRHGLSPTEIRQSLAGEFWSDRQVSPPNAESKLSPSGRRIPGRNTDRTSPAAEHKNLFESVQQAERYLLEKKICLKCHQYAEPKEGETTQELPNILPANIPRVWLTNGHFNHRTHLAINRIECSTCHAAAYPGLADGPAKIPDHEVVMIGGQDVCLKCHTPRTEDERAVPARFDCVECHRYHVIEQTKTPRITAVREP